MALEIVWTKRAKKGYDEILEYLEEQWTNKEISKFVKYTFEYIENISEYPEILKASKKKNIRSGPINKFTIITYRVRPRKQKIELLNIRSTKRKLNNYK